MITEPVTVQTPASTSNCGPGFDTLGIALSLYNFVRVQATDVPGTRYAGQDSMPDGSVAMVDAARLAFFQQTGIADHGIDFDIWGEVPIARGLGSSATLRAGAVAALNHIHGSPLDREALTALVCTLDHSPDNSCPLIQGGFCIARIDPETGRYCYTLKHPVSDAIRFVVISPEVEVLTSDARDILPLELPFEDAVRSINSAAAVVSIFASGSYALLRDAVTDYVHQPYREKLNPYTKETVNAGREAGAYAGWLSGSGSSVLCVCPAEEADAVGSAMESIFSGRKIRTRLFKLEADNHGIKIV